MRSLKENNWRIDLDEDLLEEVTNLVEYPTAFVGDFEEKYLSVPEEVLVTYERTSTLLRCPHLDGEFTTFHLCPQRGCVKSIMSSKDQKS